MTERTVLVKLIRIDDRLLHGQVFCAWVPFLGADSVIVASDAAAQDELVKKAIGTFAEQGVMVRVERVDDLPAALGDGKNAILVVGSLSDAVRLYENGMTFGAVNLGNLHHDANGRTITSSVVLDREDERILEWFISRGVAIDIRDVPASAPVKYSPVGEQSA